MRLRIGPRSWWQRAIDALVLPDLWVFRCCSECRCLLVQDAMAAYAMQPRRMTACTGIRIVSGRPPECMQIEMSPGG